MNFVVTARSADREVTFQRGSLLAARQQALALAASGMDAISVVDCRGRSCLSDHERLPTPAERLRPRERRFG